MQKTLIKLLAYEVMERISRCDAFLRDFRMSAEPVSLPLVEGIEKNLASVKNQILEEREFLLGLFSEKASSGKKTSEDMQLPQYLDKVIYQPYQMLTDLSDWLVRVSKEPVLSETSIFLKDAIPSELERELAPRAIVLAPEGRHDAAYSYSSWNLGGVLIEQLPIIDRTNPLGWLGLTRQFARQLLARTNAMVQLADKLGNKSSAFGNEEFFQSLLTHAVCLRLLGPAYYYFSVTEALLHQDALFLERVEPLLFYGLNHLNFVDKSLVILHEATEKSLDFLVVPSVSNASEKLIHKDQVAEIFRTIEQVLPEKYAFTEKSFERALALQDRLAQGTLLASVYVNPTEVIADQLQSSDPDLYSIFGQMSETPNSPREIINAGWIHKLERTPVWLYSAVSENTTHDSGFEHLQNLVERQDTLLLKSVETSEIHRMLLCTP